MANKEATAGGPYRVPRHDSGWRAFGLALATHALLFLFLWGGINWQSSEPVAVEAEVWDLTTQQAAPPPPAAEDPEPAPEPEPEPEPVPPPPAPEPAPPPPREVTPPKPDPEIALRKEREKKKEEEKRIAAEKEEQRKQKLEDDRKLAEQKKKEDEKKKREEEAKERRLAEEKAEAEKKKAEDDKKKKELAAKKAAEKKENDRLAKIRADEIRRLTGAAGGTSSGTAEKSTAPRMDGGYVAAITAKIKSNISYAGSQDVPGNPRAEFKITQLPTGEIVSVRKIKSSGIPAYDAAVENAIAKSSPLPKKKDGTVERDINATFNLKDLP